MRQNVFTANNGQQQPVQVPTPYARYGILLALGFASSLAGCKYYGSALPPEYPLSMDDAVGVASDKTGGPGGTQRAVVRKVTRPRIERPSYLPEKELAIVAPPQTLLVWTYPHVTDDNTRVFGNWSTIFLTDRYQWVRPTNEVSDGDDDAGTEAGRPAMAGAPGMSGRGGPQVTSSELDGTTNTSPAINARTATAGFSPGGSQAGAPGSGAMEDLPSE